MTARRTPDEAGRPHRVYVRLSDAERSALVETAGSAGLSVGRFLVERALSEDSGGSGPRRVVVGELFGIRRELRQLRGAASVDPAWGARLDDLTVRIDTALSGLGGLS